MDKSNEDSQSKKSVQVRSGSAKTKGILITIVVALVLLSGVWIWKTIEISSLKKNAIKDRQTLTEQAKTQIVQSHEAHLKLLAKPFVWAIRSEMMQGNISQVNLYMNEMVKEKNFQSIIVVNDKGIIVSSTDKKNEGKSFSVIGKSSDLSNNGTNLVNLNDSILVMTSPIMGFNNRLGTLYLKYSVPPSSLNK
ncbi:hypothetical protein [Arcticibacter eurypsychrophilus]|uniref:hypothetical protein n=1 Tax=Arcticibacter eurypsychrophilus TaxID=1434752 RepID=UPI00084CEE1B|nr:hypothetical protein [Arcticibacter eurypsychrophilus]